MDHTGFPAPTSFPTSMSTPGAILDRPEAEIDRSEMVLQPKPTGMVLRSQSRASRSEVVVCADIHPERPGVVTRPEPDNRATGNRIRAGRGSLIRSHRGRN